MLKESSLPLPSKRVLQLLARLRNKRKSPLAIKDLFRCVAILQLAHEPFFRSGKIDGNQDNISATLLSTAPVRLICEKVPQRCQEEGSEPARSGIGSRKNCSV